MTRKEEEAFLDKMKAMMVKIIAGFEILREDPSDLEIAGQIAKDLKWHKEQCEKILYGILEREVIRISANNDQLKARLRDVWEAE